MTVVDLARRRIIAKAVPESKLQDLRSILSINAGVSEVVQRKFVSLNGLRSSGVQGPPDRFAGHANFLISWLDDG